MTSAGELKVNAALLLLSLSQSQLAAALSARSTESAESAKRESGSGRAQRNASQKENHARVTIRHTHT